MSKKVTKTTIRNNMESLAAFIEGAEKHVIILDGEEADAGPVAMGLQATALYVLAVLDGEVPLDHDMGHLTETLMGVVMAGYLHAGEGADDDE